MTEKTKVDKVKKVVKKVQTKTPDKKVVKKVSTARVVKKLEGESERRAAIRKRIS